MCLLSGMLPGAAAGAFIYVLPKMLTETPQKALKSFSLPLLSGSVFQNLSYVFDTIIVGRLLGKEA